MILLHPIFVERVYLDIYKRNLHVEYSSLPLVNANVFVEVIQEKQQNYAQYTTKILMWKILKDL